jgi:serine/threonine-protein kinase
MQGLSITALDQRMFIRSLDSEEVRPIATDGGGMMPFFSPDGKWVGVLSRSGISKLPIEGGPTTKILQTTLLAGASWNADGNLLYQKGIAGNLGLLLREGEPVREFGTLDPGEVMLRWPEFLPDGKSFLTAASRSNVAWSDAQISLQSIANPGRKNLVQGTQPRYSPTGHLIFGREGKLFAAPFDAVAGELKGEPVMVQDGVLYDDQTGSVQYSFSNTGTLIYLNGGSVASKSNLEWVSRAGVSEPLRSATHNYIFPRLSPDGNKIAVTIAEPDSQIWIHEIARGTLSKLTLEGTLNRSPAWSHDGRRVAFYSSRAGPLNLFWQLADGSGTAERLTTTDEPAVTQSPSAFSPGDEYLAFSRISQEGRDIMMLSLRDRKITTFLKTPFEDTAPVFSPDGKWIAYSSDESGRREIYVQPFPGPGAKFQVSTEGGMEPVWNPRGGELFYRNGRKSMVVPVSTQYSFSAGNPKLLFESSHLVTPSTYANYDVTPDGQRFLMLRQAESESEALTQINVVLNWFEELKQKVPVQ